MKRWPPILWPAVSLASLLILMGLGGGEDWALITGTAIVVAAFIASAVLAFGALRGRPRPSWLYPLLGCLALFYAVTAVAAAYADRDYLPIALLSAMIPTSAALLLIATVRAKSTPDGAESTAPDGDDPYPGIDIDDETPVGDTREISDAREGRPVNERPSP
jgi:peptidoglycan/LPS O-acetylase OafA/YrhL